MRRFLDDLIASEAARFGLLVSTGLVVLALLVRQVVDASPKRRRTPAPWAGVLLAAAGWAVIARFIEVPVGITAGIPLLVAAGLLGRRLFEVVVAALPGAIAVVYWGDLPPTGYRPWLVVAVAAAAGLVVDFDRAFQRSAIGPGLLLMSMIGIVVTVPDTELAIGLAAAALPVGLAGFPLRSLSLGPGAAGVVGLVGHVAGSASAIRPGALVGVIGALGLMLVEPVGRHIGRRSRTALQDLADGGARGVLVVVAIHAVLVLGLTRFAGLRQDLTAALLWSIPFAVLGVVLAAAPAAEARSLRGGLEPGHS